MLNHKQVISLKPKSTTYKKGLGNGLFVVVDKVLFFVCLGSRLPIQAMDVRAGGCGVPAIQRVF